MTEEELKVIQKYYAHLSQFAKTEETLQKSHSIDEAERLHARKKHAKGPGSGQLPSMPE